VRTLVLSNPAIHTAKRGARWVNIREGSNRALGVDDSHDEAATFGSRIACQDRVEHVNHHADGSIHEFTLGS
jgi:hypothetical protein